MNMEISFSSKEFGSEYKVSSYANGIYIYKTVITYVNDQRTEKTESMYFSNSDLPRLILSLQKIVY